MTGRQVITNQTTCSVESYILEVAQTMKPATVHDLIQIIQPRFPLSKEVITEIILQLESQHKICFTKKTCQTSRSLKEHLFSSSAAWYWSTLTVALIATVTVFTIPQSLYPFTYLRHVIGLVFVGFISGFVFLKVLFPSKISEGLFSKSKSFFTLEWMILSVGCSIAVVALIGLVLNFTPWGLSVMPLTFTLFIVIVVFASLGVIRSHNFRLSE